MPEKKVEEKTRLGKRLVQLRDRLRSSQEVDGSVITRYNELESDFKEFFPEISFTKYKPITQLSKFERFLSDITTSYQCRLNPISDRLEYMISCLPEEANRKGNSIMIANIENFYQNIEEMNIDNSTKLTINQYIKDLECEIKKPKKDMKKIKEIITHLISYELPAEMLKWFINIFLQQLS